MKRLICACTALFLAAIYFVPPALASSRADISEISVRAVLGEGGYVFVGERFRADIMAAVPSPGEERETVRVKSSDGLSLSSGYVSLQPGYTSPKAQKLGSVSVTAQAPGAAWISAGTSAIESKRTPVVVVEPPTLINKSTGGEINSTVSLYANPYADRVYTLALIGFGGLGHTVDIGVASNSSGARATVNYLPNDPEVSVRIPAGANEGIITLNVDYGIKNAEGFTGLKKVYSIYIADNPLSRFTTVSIRDKGNLPDKMAPRSVVAVGAVGLPAHSDEPVFWMSSNPACVSINSSPFMEESFNDMLGMYTSAGRTVYLRATGAGTARISVKGLNSGLSDSFDITVERPYAYPVKLTISTPSADGIPARNGSLRLNAQIMPATASQRVIWRWVTPTSPPRGWAISANGELTSSADAAYPPNGEIVLEAAGVDLMDIATPTSVSATVRIKVTDPINIGAVEIENPMEAPLIIGTQRALLATVLDSSGNPLEDQAVQWSSSDPSVASVEKNTGRVKGLSAGRTILTASSVANPKLAASYELTVLESMEGSAYLVEANLLSVKSKPSDASANLGSLKKESLVMVKQDLGNGWASIRYLNTIAYIKKDGLRETQSAAVLSGSLNMRDLPGSEGKIIAKAGFGEDVVALAPLEGKSAWMPVLYNNSLLYTSSAHIAKHPFKAEVSAATVKVRMSANAYGTQIATLKKGDAVEIISVRDNFYMIKYGSGENTGYVPVNAVKITAK